MTKPKLSLEPLELRDLLSANLLPTPGYPSIVNALSRATTGGSLNPGTAPNSATGRGVGIFGGSGNALGGTTTEPHNVKSGPADAGILPGGGTGVQDNYIGGALTRPGAPGNVLGGTNAGAGNTSVDKTDSGGELDVDAASNVVKGNESDNDATGTQAGDNAVQDGSTSDSSNNAVGGTAAGAGNTSSGNRNDGVRIPSGGGNVVQGNPVGTEVMGARLLGNLTGAEIGRNSAAGAGAGNLIWGHRIDRVQIPSGGGGVAQGHYLCTAILLAMMKEDGTPLCRPPLWQPGPVAERPPAARSSRAEEDEEDEGGEGLLPLPPALALIVFLGGPQTRGEGENHGRFYGHLRALFTRLLRRFPVRLEEEDDLANQLYALLWGDENKTIRVNAESGRPADDESEKELGEAARKVADRARNRARRRPDPCRWERMGRRKDAAGGRRRRSQAAPLAPANQQRARPHADLPRFRGGARYRAARRRG
jgi:hypothetical protein